MQSWDPYQVRPPSDNFSHVLVGLPMTVGLLHHTHGEDFICDRRQVHSTPSEKWDMICSLNASPKLPYTRTGDQPTSRVRVRSPWLHTNMRGS